MGILKFVKERCSLQINNYDRCLDANAENPEECVQVLKELYICTEATSIAYREEEEKKKQEGKPVAMETPVSTESDKK